MVVFAITPGVAARASASLAAFTDVALEVRDGRGGRRLIAISGLPLSPSGRVRSSVRKPRH